MARVTVVWRRELGVVAVNWADVLDGEIVNAAWAIAGMVAKPRAGRKVAADLDTAAWADTERLIRDVLADIAADPGLPRRLPGHESARLEASLRRPEVQGALQALLAVRLTDAPEEDAARAREAVRLALATPRFAVRPAAQHPLDAQAPLEVRVPPDTRRNGPAPRVSATSERRDTQRLSGPPTREPAYVVPNAEKLTDYIDAKICALAARLEGRVGFAGLAQVRAEAYSARIVALLGAIERQVAALADATKGGQAETEYIYRYRRQARQQHGFVTPPDSDRRRRIPVADIYVPTRIELGEPSEATARARSAEPASLTVWDLSEQLDRTVLLGDPGGGKTTAANVLTDHFAADAARRIPFLVTLREYARKTPIEWSVAEHIEHNLNAMYQSPVPAGLVERLLLTGQAVVIFDGLDELLDTSRRRDVSDRVEQFCSAYPLAPVLVTSRVVGYDQARLDDSQFTCYRLGGFGDDEVVEYAGKWFRSQEKLATADAAAKAQAFLAESAHATDLRANPLLLSLMCILYRGAGSLPGDRAGIYARCAELLLRKWDEQRDLYRKLDADHLVEPTLRYLAWWLFTREDSQTTATERELMVKTAEFLYERGYETQEQARVAARKFIEFCRGRMWVFSDAGTTADGEKLYGFTHRTFMEYFAAWHLAVTSESPEELARTLAPRIAVEEWGAVSELAIKIKTDTSDRGADRVYAALLGSSHFSFRTEQLLLFLVTCLPATRPSPAMARHLTHAALDYALSSAPEIQLRLGPLDSLLASGGHYRSPIAVEMSTHIASLVASGDVAGRGGGLRLVVSLPLPSVEHYEFWHDHAQEQCRLYAAEIAAAAVDDNVLRVLALYAGALTPRDALAMPDGLSALATTAPIVTITRRGTMHTVVPASDYVAALARALLTATAGAEVVSGVTAIGEHLTGRRELPWVTGQLRRNAYLVELVWDFLRQPRELPALTHDGNLGTAAVLCLAVEITAIAFTRTRLAPDAQPESTSGSMRPLDRYIARRIGAWAGELPDLPIPAEFGQLFRDWAEGHVNLVEEQGDKIR